MSSKGLKLYVVNAFTKLPASQPVTAFVYLPLNNAQGELAVRAPTSQQNQQQWLVLFRPNLSPSKFFCAHGVHDFEDPSGGESIVIKGLQGENPCNIFLCKCSLLHIWSLQASLSATLLFIGSLLKWDRQLSAQFPHSSRLGQLVPKY